LASVLLEIQALAVREVVAIRLLAAMAILVLAGLGCREAKAILASVVRIQKLATPTWFWPIVKDRARTNNAKRLVSLQ